MREVSIVRSDNGIEFCNQDLEEYFARKGITHQKNNIVLQAMENSNIHFPGLILPSLINQILLHLRLLISLDNYPALGLTFNPNNKNKILFNEVIGNAAEEEEVPRKLFRPSRLISFRQGHFSQLRNIFKLERVNGNF